MGDRRRSKRQHRRRDAQVGYLVTDPRNFKIDRFANPDNLYEAFRQLEECGGHGAGIDGFRPMHFSDTELRPILRLVSKTLLDGTYRPYPVRECEIPKSSSKVRVLALHRFTDRAVAKALLNCLSDFWQQRGRGWSGWQIFARLDQEIRRRQAYVLAIDDVKNCFPNAPLDEVMKWHSYHIDHSELLRLIERVIRGHEGLNKEIGLDQGSPYSPIAMDVLLHHVLDSVLEAQSGNTLLLRYVDNLTFLCGSVSEGTKVLEMARHVGEVNHLPLKAEDGEPQDIRDRDYDTVVLGFIPQWIDGRLALFTPESAFENLKQGLCIANEAERPEDNAKRRCNGWLQMQGPALTRSVERGVVDRVVDMARQAGFRNVTHRELLEVADSARRTWHHVLENSK
jgi:hypothetical protein